jgi:hypothetical protein
MHRDSLSQVERAALSQNCRNGMILSAIMTALALMSVVRLAKSAAAHGTFSPPASSHFYLPDPRIKLPVSPNFLPVHRLGSLITKSLIILYKFGNDRGRIENSPCVLPSTREIRPAGRRVQRRADRANIGHIGMAAAGAGECS